MNVLRLFARSLIRLIRLTWLSFKFPNLTIEPPSLIKYDDIGAIKMGDNVYIGAFSELIIIKNSSYSSVDGKLTIGNRVVIGKGANIRAAGGEIVIGDACLLAQNVSLIAANHLLDSSYYYRDQPWNPTRVGIIIGKNVWLGAGVIVLPGVEIGDSSVIAAGAVVTKPVPENQIWAGVPAHFVRDVDL